MKQSTLAKDTFTILLRGFDAIIHGHPDIETVRQSLNELSEAAKIDNELTYWQKDAIIKRCDYYLQGQYGEQVKKQDNRSDYSKGLR